MGETRRLTLREAADATGMPLDALRKRVYRGTIAAEKVDGQYFISAETIATLIEPVATPSDKDETPGETVLGHVSDKGETAPLPSEMTLEYIGSLKSEISFLRDQLDKRSQELADERERSDVLHREAFARIEALTAGLVTGDSNDGDDPASAEEPANAPLTHEDRSGAIERPQTRNPGAEPEAASRGGFGGFWDWLRGK